MYFVSLTKLLVCFTGVSANGKGYIEGMKLLSGSLLDYFEFFAPGGTLFLVTAHIFLARKRTGARRASAMTPWRWGPTSSSLLVT